MMPDAGALATILLVVGLFLISLELMIPSFGLIGISAFVCLVISAWCAWQAWWGSAPGFFWTYVGFWVFGPLLVFFGTFFLIQKTPLGGMVVLRGPSDDSIRPETRDPLKELVGKSGRAVSPLTPGGMVEIDHERHHAETEGPLIESGTPVRVVATRGARLVVRQGRANDLRGADVDRTKAAESASPGPPEVPVQPTTETTASVPSEPPDRAEEPDQLDFDIPENYTPG